MQARKHARNQTQKQARKQAKVSLTAASVPQNPPGCALIIRKSEHDPFYLSLSQSSGSCNGHGTSAAVKRHNGEPAAWQGKARQSKAWQCKVRQSKSKQKPSKTPANKTHLHVRPLNKCTLKSKRIDPTLAWLTTLKTWPSEDEIFYDERHRMVIQTSRSMNSNCWRRCQPNSVPLDASCLRASDPILHLTNLQCPPIACCEAF